MQTASAKNEKTPKSSFYKKLDKIFEKIAHFTSKIVGSPAWFIFSLSVILIWIPSKSLFKTDELWHLFINTFTTILTFLMMALLHSSQSRWEAKIEALEKKQESSLRKVGKETKKINKEIKKTNKNSIKTDKELEASLSSNGKSNEGENDFDSVDTNKSVQITSLL